MIAREEGVEDAEADLALSRVPRLAGWGGFSHRFPLLFSTRSADSHERIESGLSPVPPRVQVKGDHAIGPLDPFPTLPARVTRC
jgi:hypothetical protein